LQSPTELVQLVRKRRRQFTRGCEAQAAVEVQLLFAHHQFGLSAFGDRYTEEDSCHGHCKQQELKLQNRGGRKVPES